MGMKTKLYYSITTDHCSTPPQSRLESTGHPRDKADMLQESGLSDYGMSLLEAHFYEWLPILPSEI